jgi:hypothetical protein
LRRSQEIDTKNLNAIRFRYIFVAALAVAVLSLARPLDAQQNWHTKVGAETPSMGRQALAFLLNEIWIHAGS